MASIRINAMRRITACSAFISLLLAIVYAPLFHVHEADDHENESSTIHAHFPELPHAEHDGETIDHGADQDSRPVDVLAMMAPCFIEGVFVVVEEPLVISPSKGCSGFAVVDDPRAHDPPSRIALVPRSPPV